MNVVAGEPPERVCEAAADRIRVRRARCDDSELLPDDPAGVARYVRTHRKVPASVLAADAEDALLIRRALKTIADREDLGAIQVARACGITWERIAAIWGFRGRSGAKEMSQRLEAGAGPERRKDARATRRRAPVRSREPSWVAAFRPEIERVTADVVSAAGRLPEELAGTIGELADVLGDPEFGTGSVVGWLSTLCYEARNLVPPPDDEVLLRASALVAVWQGMR
jgi:hypothetical protein